MSVPDGELPSALIHLKINILFRKGERERERQKKGKEEGFRMVREDRKRVNPERETEARGRRERKKRGNKKNWERGCRFCSRID